MLLTIGPIPPMRGLYSDSFTWKLKQNRGWKDSYFRKLR